MNIFPAQYSTLSAIALNHHIEKAYGLVQFSCRLLVKNVNDVYILEDGHSKYIFKVYRTSYRTLSEIKGEVELLNILRENGIPVSYPVMDLSRNQIQEFNAAEGTRYGVLFTFAKGKVMPVPDDVQLKIIGKNIALMHNITAVCQLKHERMVYDVDNTLRKPLEIIRSRFADLPGEYAFLEDVADKVTSKLKQFDTSGFSYGYCHYDLLPKNFHFDENNNITVFDFDWAGKGFLVNDLMTFFVQFFFLIHFKAITREEADRIFMVCVDGYREHRNLSAGELEMIPYLGVMFWIYAFGFYEENFDDFANGFLTPKFIRDRVELIKKWTEWYCKF